MKKTKWRWMLNQTFPNCLLVVRDTTLQTAKKGLDVVDETLQIENIVTKNIATKNQSGIVETTVIEV
jgi:TRAP-type mannitol/chloroaromatic compound transport system substrate-binding protein